jgi:hypothetical protein
MRATDPRAKDKQNSERPESTGKAYERMVEDLFMGSEEEEEETEGSDEDDTE